MTKAITDLTQSLAHRDEWPFTSSHTYHRDNCAYQAKNNPSVRVYMWGYFWGFLTQGRSVMDRCWESTPTCIMSFSNTLCDITFKWDDSQFVHLTIINLYFQFVGASFSFFLPTKLYKFAQIWLFSISDLFFPPKHRLALFNASKRDSATSTDV